MQKRFGGPKLAGGVRAGVLGEHVQGFVEALRWAGYEPSSIHDKVLLVAQLGRWLEHRRLGMRDLDEDRVGQFLRPVSYTHLTLPTN